MICPYCDFEGGALFFHEELGIICPRCLQDFGKREGQQ